MNAVPEQLARVAEATGRIITSVSADLWAQPTPCSEWSVQDLVEHVVAGNNLFATALSDEPAAPAVSVSPAELPDAYDRSVRALLDSFGRPGALGRQATVPFGTVPGAVALHLRLTELLVHGWDLARATGQPAAFPEDLVEQELAFTQRALGDIPAGRQPFGTPRPVADDAPAIDRLAALLGRSVSSSHDHEGSSAS